MTIPTPAQIKEVQTILQDLKNATVQLNAELDVIETEEENTQ